MKAILENLLRNSQQKKSKGSRRPHKNKRIAWHELIQTTKGFCAHTANKKDLVDDVYLQTGNHQYQHKQLNIKPSPQLTILETQNYNPITYINNKIEEYFIQPKTHNV